MVVLIARNHFSELQIVLERVGSSDLVVELAASLYFDSAAMLGCVFGPDGVALKSFNFQVVQCIYQRQAPLFEVSKKTEDTKLSSAK